MGLDVAVYFGGEAIGVVTFRKRYRGRDATQQIVLLEHPVASKIPPLGAIEQPIETRSVEGFYLLGGAAQGFGGEYRVRRHLSDPGDERRPDLGRHLIGGITAKTGEAETRVMACDFGKIVDQRFSVFQSPVVDFRKIAPFREFAGIVRVDGTR